MGKVKIGTWEVEEDVLEQQHIDAKRHGKEWLRDESQARTAQYDAVTDRLVIELKNGVIFQVPRTLIQGLSDIPPEELHQVRLGPRGASLHWDRHGLDFSISGLLMGVFGTRAWMAALGQKGGRVKSLSKANASRQNGKKGGRPASAGYEQAGLEQSV